MPPLLWCNHLGSRVVRQRHLRAISSVGRTSSVSPPWGERTRISHPRGKDNCMAVAHPRPSAVVVIVPVNGRSAAVEVLLLSFSFGIFRSYVSREGNGGDATYSYHIPSGVCVLACLRAPDRG